METNNITFKNGDRIKHDYTHPTNQMTKSGKVRKGVFIREGMNLKTKEKTALVHFDGNKSHSQVLLSELTKE